MSEKFSVFDFEFNQILDYCNGLDSLEKQISYLEFVMKEYENSKLPYMDAVKNEWELYGFLDRIKDEQECLLEIQEYNKSQDINKCPLFHFHFARIMDFCKTLKPLTKKIIYLEAVKKDLKRYLHQWKRSYPYIYYPIAGFLKPDVQCYNKEYDMTQIQSLADEFLDNIDSEIYLLNLRLKLEKADSQLQEKESEKAKSQITKLKFPKLQDLKWHEVTIILYHEETIRVEARKEKTNYEFYQIEGFEDKRKKCRPNSLWELFKYFAKHNGVIVYENKIEMSSLMNISRLRKTLKNFMGISDDPFYPYSKNKEYRMRFKKIESIIDNNSDLSENEDNSTKKDVKDMFNEFQSSN